MFGSKRNLLHAQETGNKLEDISIHMFIEEGVDIKFTC
jgi:hypothetical protein